MAKENVARLAGLGYRFIGPDEGWLACRNVGAGRMSEAGKIVDEVTGMLAGRGVASVHDAARGVETPRKPGA